MGFIPGITGCNLVNLSASDSWGCSIYSSIRVTFLACKSLKAFLVRFPFFCSQISVLMYWNFFNYGIDGNNHIDTVDY